MYSTYNPSNAPIPLDNLLDYLKTAYSAINLASKECCVIALMTQHSAKPGSGRMYDEVQQVLYTGGNILPVLIGDVNFDDRWMQYIVNDQGFLEYDRLSLQFLIDGDYRRFNNILTDNPQMHHRVSDTFGHCDLNDISFRIIHGIPIDHIFCCFK